VRRWGDQPEDAGAVDGLVTPVDVEFLVDMTQVLGVDEHAWRHTRRGDKFVTVMIDLTPVRDGTGPSRLLDMAGGRPKQVFKTWFEAQTPAFRDGIEIVGMDGFTGFKTAAARAP
jgi:transposase